MFRIYHKINSQITDFHWKSISLDSDSILCVSQTSLERDRKGEGKVWEWVYAFWGKELPNFKWSMRKRHFENTSVLKKINKFLKILSGRF